MLHDDIAPLLKQYLVQLNLSSKAFLLLVNVSCHPEKEIWISREIRVISLPANKT